MEEKLVRVPFDVELAKKIQAGEIDGKIYDVCYNCPARIVDFNFQTMFGKLNVVISERIKEGEVFCACNDKGVIFLRKENKFDDEPTFFLEIPEYMTFKDGDVATLGWKNLDGDYCEWVTILKKIDADKYEIVTEDYVTVCLKSDSKNYFPIDFDCKSDGAKWARRPTKEEVQKLVDALKASNDPRAKEYLKRFFNIDKEEPQETEENPKEDNPKHEFKPFDKVLVRESNDFPWRIDLFSHIEGGPKPYVCLYHYWKYCIPYEGNERLLGTTDNE